MGLLDEIAEARIAEAQRQGMFDDLPGVGQALRLDDDALVPEELRVGYRLLKNAGYVPAELQLRKEIETLEQLIRAAESVEDQTHLTRRLRYLLLKLDMSRPADRCSPWYQYHAQLLQKYTS